MNTVGGSAVNKTMIKEHLTLFEFRNGDVMDLTRLSLKKSLNRYAMLMSMRILSRAFSSIIRFHDQLKKSNLYQEGEDAITFARRVKRAIARKGGLVDLEWDGALKRERDIALHSCTMTSAFDMKIYRDVHKIPYNKCTPLSVQRPLLQSDELVYVSQASTKRS
uniref:Uncharacterized protein n=1 Tax=Heterorhabditis bacteriophora TaxID=37862 RepID=A0A1I7XCA8_HETBA